MFDQVNIKVKGVIENMSWFTGDDGKQYHLFGSGGGKDLADRLETGVSEAKYEELVKDLTALREKVHYSFVKTELEHDVVETIEKMELLRATVGSCLLRNEEMQQTIAGVAKDIAILRRDLANNAADSIPEIVDLSEHPRPELEPGEVPQCTCKRKRR